MNHPTNATSTGLPKIYRAYEVFIRRVANTPDDGWPCPHLDGCHDHDDCEAVVIGRFGWGFGCEENTTPRTPCPLGECCEDEEMNNLERLDLLRELVAAARSLLAMPDLYADSVS